MPQGRRNVCLWLVGSCVCMPVWKYTHTNAHLCTWNYFVNHLSVLNGDFNISFWVCMYLVLKALKVTGDKRFKVSQTDISATAKETRWNISHHQTLARPKIQKTCHFWKSGALDVSLRQGYFLLFPLVCVLSADWQLGMGVCVCGVRIHLLSAWLYMVCFVFASHGQQWHIEDFISRKQVPEEVAHISLLLLCIWTYPTCMHVMEGIHVSACMCVSVHSYFSVSVIFAGLLQRRINQWCLG